ncbi:MAG: hypothetical protein HY040_01315 [Planctomycetes bacterium]|nr:hypothetical protein [Planctomycetota bacterium]
MHEHSPNPLEGPIRGSEAWWRATAPAELAIAPESDLAPQDDKGIRRELVNRVRKEIAAGTYDTPEKWQAALDRLLTRLDR